MSAVAPSAGHDEYMTNRYVLPFYCDLELNVADGVDNPGDSWTAQDYELSAVLGTNGHYEAQAAVEAAWKATHQDQADAVRFDSEFMCFFAHTDDEATMLELAAVVADLVDAA